ncbi:hypothetical protein JYB87_14805 [Shewanella avicenniae]|uniref:Lipoprotein n=1 Tax=Shewanella avicenniae TaxID=2814294 RepID=A0ABX7QNQ2_9GAMM|nr:hypothetical protein [Shewanella avicenniae]QSX32994.1 hypothetical protein JYB87_14805 [Shewanella avicenniae]
MARIFIRIVGVLLLLSLTGCGDDTAERIAQLQQADNQRLSRLSQMLDNGEIRNAMLLKHYTELLASERSDLKPLLTQLGLDATAEGPMFKSLQQRLSDASNSANFPDKATQLAELQNIYEAADPTQYNDMLSDPLNVVADMSNGTLARVNAISNEASKLANGAENYGAGSQLVGNPSYGHWRTDSSGMSFWEWYGMYSMFNNIFNRPIYYDNWSRHRDYSYYNDVGRYRYSSPEQRRTQDSVYQRTKKSFDSQGKRFDSPYAKSRTGSSALSRQSTSTPKPTTSASQSKSSSSTFRSNYAKDSSFRNSSSRTTRGISRGK